MATFIPALNSCKSKMTPGELRFATRLHTNLDEDFYCWFDIPVGGNKSRYPDFMILNADFGLLSIEVKDWKLDNIQSIDKHSASVLVGGSVKRLANPLEQSRQCIYKIVQQLQKDPDLLRHGGRYQGQLKFPYGFGVAFPNITSSQAAAIEGWDDLFPAHRVIYQDQMTESVDSDDFQCLVENFFDVKFGIPLNENMLNRVRWHVFPEIRIADEKRLFDADITVDAKTFDTSKIKQFDIEQEKRARQIGDGHRVIRGVAGSGKTQIIAYRCQYFAEGTRKPVLALYYNISAKAVLRNILTARGVLDRVHIRHFHQWCAEQLRAARVSGSDDVTTAFAAALAAGKIATDQYSAVMVDEGQDFEKDWVSSIAWFCDAEGTPLLFVYDDAQSIYEKRSGLAFTLTSAGIQAKGRTTVMKVNYRNSRYVQQFASRLLQENLLKTVTDDTPREEWLEPVSVGETGECPKIVLCRSPQEEIVKIARWLHNLNEQRSVPWGNICVILRTKADAGYYTSMLHRHGVPAYDLSANREAKEALDLSDQTVKLTTVHSSKGLEFPYVLIPHLCSFAEVGDRAIEDARLLYVAMTRSTGQLVLTAQRRTPLIDRMQTLVEEISLSIQNADELTKE